MSSFTRRALVLALPGFAAACTTATKPVASVPAASTVPSPVKNGPIVIGDAPDFTQAYPEMYAQVVDGDFTLPAVPLGRIVDQKFLRNVVDYSGSEEPGTIVIDPEARFLYLVHRNHRAIRYGVGVGREGFGWSGDAYVRSKQKWPKWFPPAEMRERQPELQKYADGMPGGLSNPLGARAHYLWQGNKDTYFRIHGTTEPWTIGTRVSSGCIRMINHDVMDLYERVAEGSKVIVKGANGFPSLST